VKKGFTLIELIIVIVVVGVLSTIGVTQYARAIEQSRQAEARTILAMLYSEAMEYYKENGVLPWLSQIGFSYLHDDACASNERYFSYECGDSSGHCYALRCITGTGKTPGWPVQYRIDLYNDGSYNLSSDF